ncbi:MAG: sortase [Patescibacteria group bacterium]
MEPQSYFRKDKLLTHMGVFLVSSFLVLLILSNYGRIVDLYTNLSYSLSPAKRSAENEKLTNELIALYGSGAAVYYRNDNSESNVNEPSVPKNNEVLSGNYLYIPKLNVSAPVVTSISIDSKTILEQLKQGVLMYPGSGVPGGGGSSVIIGHSSSSIPWQEYGRVFAGLPKLSKGDMIIVNYNGRKYSYKVENKLTGSVNELASLNIQNDLVLGTCWPIGTDEKRIIITASLVPSN